MNLAVLEGTTETQSLKLANYVIFRVTSAQGRHQVNALPAKRATTSPHNSIQPPTVITIMDPVL